MATNAVTNALTHRPPFPSVSASYQPFISCVLQHLDIVTKSLAERQIFCESGRLRDHPTLGAHLDRAEVEEIQEHVEKRVSIPRHWA